MYIIADVKNARDRMNKKFNTETQQVYYVPVCAFGILNTCYVDSKEAGPDHQMRKCCGIIKYRGEYPDISAWK
jgi:hypothetical protein